MKYKLLIFLDIDGVLNTHTTAKTKENLICSVLVTRFNEFLDGKDIGIVISSSWRHDMDELRLQLEKAGFRHWSKVIGKTPTYVILTKRGEQIARWLKDNRYDGEYVVIDDEIDDIVSFVSRNIMKTDPMVGITEDDIASIGAIYEIINKSSWGNMVDTYNDFKKVGIDLGVFAEDAD